MIRPEMRVSKVMHYYPQRRKRLVAASPAMAKLQSPLLRPAIPRLVGVGQAARVGVWRPTTW